MADFKPKAEQFAPNPEEALGAQLSLLSHSTHYLEATFVLFSFFPL